MRELEQVPPHDEQAECSVLGAMLMHPKAAEIAVGDLRPDDFYLPRHRTLFKFMAAIFRDEGQLDETVVTSRLERANLLESVGGRDAIGNLLMNTPGPAGIEGYCQLVNDRATQRALLETGAALMKLGYKPGDNNSEILLTQARKRFDELPFKRLADGVKLLQPKDLLEYDTEHDASCLLGNRWLCQSGSCLFVGQAGLGKSALMMQCAIQWGLGLPLFGITPTKPLKSLMIQGENDRGDLSEQFKGVINGMNLAGNIDALDGKLFMLSECARAGDEFISYLRALVREHQPDLVWIDPLLSYLGADVCSQEACSHFLRNGLNVIALETGACMMVMHHTAKPSRDPMLKYKRGDDMSYLGIGSSELANWPRAVVVLQPSGDDGLYELRLAKRGQRAGMTETDAAPEGQAYPSQTRVCYLEHSKSGICWMRAAQSPNVLERAEMQEAVQDILESIRDSAEPVRSKQLVAIIKRRLCCRDTRAYAFKRDVLNVYLRCVHGVYQISEVQRD